MNKHIFSLMLSAALFTTPPAFGMKTARDEDDKSATASLCRLIPELQIIVFEELDAKSISSIACGSKYYNKLIESKKIKIYLNTFYKDWKRPYGYEEAIRKVDFSVHIMTSGDEQTKFYSAKVLDLSFKLKKDQSEEKKEAIISFFPSHERLKLLVKGKSINLNYVFPHIFLFDGGYINFDNHAIAERPKKSEITDDETFNLGIQPSVAKYTEEGDNWIPTKPTIEINYTLSKAKEKRTVFDHAVRKNP